MKKKAVKSVVEETPKFVLETGIPISEPSSGGTLYPFREMEVGHSFFSPKLSGKVSPSASSFGKRHNKTFVSRTVTENGIKGTRVWRVK